MKPKPLAALKNFTVPFCILLILCPASGGQRSGAPVQETTFGQDTQAPSASDATSSGRARLRALSSRRLLRGLSDDHELDLTSRQHLEAQLDADRTALR